MTLIQLQYFRVMAKILHYTKASQALRISQPSLSYSLAELEKELGVELFVKKGKKVFLSPYGEEFLPCAEEVFTVLDQGVKRLEMMSRQVSGAVNLGYVHSVSFSLVPRLLERFYKDIGGSTLSFYLTQGRHQALMEGLRSGEIDLAITVDLPDDLPGRPLVEQELFLVVPKSHPFAARDSVSFGELDGEPFVSLLPNSSLPQTMERYFSQYNIKPNIVMEAQGCDAVVNYIALGIGVSVIPLIPAIPQLGVKVVKISDCDCRRTIYLCWQGGEVPNAAAVRARQYFLESKGVD